MEPELVNDQTEEEVASEERLYPLGRGAACKETTFIKWCFLCLFFWEANPPERVLSSLILQVDNV